MQISIEIVILLALQKWHECTNKTTYIRRNNL